MVKLPPINWNYLSSLVRLFRLPNLVMIVLVQVLLRFSILEQLLFSGSRDQMSGTLDFILLVLASVFIAGGGYVVNDYLDVPGDQINRPGKNPFEKDIAPSTGLLIYWILTGAGLLAGTYLAYRLESLLLGLVFPCISILLWLYSSKYKRMPIVGNIVVAFLSALTVMIVWYSEFLHLRLAPDAFAERVPDMKMINMYFMGYGLFAFLVTVIREIIKDIEDEEGDRHTGCNTMPVVFGRKISVRVAAALIILCMLILAYAMYIFNKRAETLVFWYCAAAIQLPFLYLLYQLFFARKSAEFHFLSNICKVIMVAGILSIQLI